MTTFTAGYMIGSLAKGSINRKLALTRLAPPELKVGRAHGLGSVVVVLLFVVSWWMRRASPQETSGTARP